MISISSTLSQKPRYTNFDATNTIIPNPLLAYLAYNCHINLGPKNSGAAKVENPNALETLLRNDLDVSKDGYLHTYVSNGSEAKVNFDNFLVQHQRGKLRQMLELSGAGTSLDSSSPRQLGGVNDYYPYGLTIAGINSNSDEYLNKYTSKELQTGEFDTNLSTGLEMFDFGSRFYDPQLGVWFTPDPAEQFHNPYLGIGNNPVMYVDPDGEWIFKFLGTKITAAVDFLKTGFTDGGFEFWNWGKKNFRDAWRNFDPTAEWSKTNKAWRIDAGRFKTDGDKNFIGRSWQFIKRNTWQLPNTLIGSSQSHANNLVGNVERVDYFHGSTVVYNYGEGNGGSSIGGYININQFDNSGRAQQTNYGNALLLHEYGHYLQEQAFGPLSLFSALNSGLSAGFGKNSTGRPFNTLNNHKEAWFEQDANARARRYFEKKDDFRNFEIFSGYTALDNFNFRFPNQHLSRRFWWYMPPLTFGHVYYTAWINTGL